MRLSCDVADGLDHLSGGANRRALGATRRRVAGNVLGSEQMAVLTRDGSNSPFVVARAVGDAALRLQSLRLRAPSTDELMTMLGNAATDATGHDLLACVPLLCGPQVAGAVLVFALVEHKYRFEPADLELLELLSVHGRSALAVTAPRVAPA